MISLSDDIQIEKFMHCRKMVQHWVFAMFCGPVHATGVDGVEDSYPIAFLVRCPLSWSSDNDRCVLDPACEWES